MEVGSGNNTARVSRTGWRHLREKVFTSLKPEEPELISVNDGISILKDHVKGRRVSSEESCCCLLSLGSQNPEKQP